MSNFSQYHVGPTVLPRINGVNPLIYGRCGKVNMRLMFELALIEAGYTPVPVGTYDDHDQVAWTLREKPTGIDIQEGVKECLQHTLITQYKFPLPLLKQHQSLTSLCMV
jgi:hypothetical protein